MIWDQGFFVGADGSSKFVEEAVLYFLELAEQSAKHNLEKAKPLLEKFNELREEAKNSQREK